MAVGGLRLEGLTEISEQVGEGRKSVCALCVCEYELAGGAPVRVPAWVCARHVCGWEYVATWVREALQGGL